MRSRTRLALATSLSTVTVAVLAAAGINAAQAAPAAGSLGDAAARTGRTFGAVADSRRFAADPQYLALLDREFSGQSSDPELNWDALQPNRGTFTYRFPATLFPNLHGRRLRGHALVWYSHLPAWTQGLNTPDRARTELLNHISTVVGHFRGQVSTWDVVNEAFSNDGTRRRLSFQTQLGDGWIGEAFTAARAADPSARLCYNDYGIENPASVKSNAVYGLVRDLVAAGVPIDCVGFESHFRPETPVPAAFQANLQRFADLGVDVELTELDYAGKGQPQADQYAAAVNACLAVARCTSITVSTVRDKDSFRGNDLPALLQNDGTPKLAYTAVLDALNAAAAKPAGAGPVLEANLVG